MSNLIEKEYYVIADIVEPGVTVLDLGCGHGDLLALLAEQKQVKGQGIEIDQQAIYDCVGKGLSVFHGDIDTGLPEFADRAFDYVILSQSMQQVKKPDTVLTEALRVGKKVIVSFPNFAHLSARLQLGIFGRVPVNPSLPFEWYNTPNTHFLSFNDFINYCRKRGIKIEKQVYLNDRGRIYTFPNLQVEETLNKVGQPLGLRTAVLIGGASMYNQVQALRRGPRIIVATPGRLLDHLGQGTIRLNDVSILVLDEADRMLDMGFAPQIEKILPHVPKDRQTMLFSATIPEKIVNIAARHMKLPVSVEIAPSGTAAKNVVQELFIIKKEEKSQLLIKLLEQYRGTVLIFSRTKRGAARITRGLRTLNLSAAEIHADRSMAQRREALEGFKTGKYRILVATDIAARGIDVKGIELVINYDLPDDAENYVHRIGRTGRMEHEGRAISFATPEQRGDVRTIESIMKKTLPVVRHPDVRSAEFYAPVVRSFGPRRRRR